jgi:hypothetical protein
MAENIKWDNEPSQPEGGNIAWEPEVGGLESFGRGAAQAFGLGYSPQLIAAVKTGHMPGSTEPEYLVELAKQKAATNAAWEQHPYLYGTGMVASAIPAAVGAVLGAPEEAAIAGGLGAADLLSGSSNIASLGGAGLRALAGEGAGMAPSALRGVATAAENPLVQGAIYGSSEGENLSDKLSGAAAGAIGAKVAPMVIGAAGKTVGALAGKVADPLVHALTGGADSAAIAGSLAHDIGVSLPSASVGQGTIPNVASKFDFFNQVPKSSARTLSQLGEKVSDLSGEYDPEKAGEAIRSAVGQFLQDDQDPMGFRSQMNNFYKPVSNLSSSSKKMDIANIRAAVDAARGSSIGTVSNIEPTLGIVSKALQNEEGLTFDQIHALRQIIDDQRTFNRMPGSAGLNDTILGQLRAAASKDMDAYAQSVGGPQAVQDLTKANQNAQKLYNLRDTILKTVGNPNAGPGFKPSSNIYTNIISAASAKKPNIAALAPLQQVVNNYDPEAWSLVGKNYTNNLAPDGNFSFGNFNKLYNDALHPQGKDLIFGQVGDGGARDTLEKINSLGRISSDGTPLGVKLDSLAQKAGSNISPIAFPETAVALGETALFGGLPLRTMTAAGVGSLAGAYGARNIARPVSQYVPSTGARIAGETVKRTAPLVGAQIAAPALGPAVKGAGIYGGARAINQLPPSVLAGMGLAAQRFLPQASGGRTERASGGRTTHSAASKANVLINMVDKIRKEQGNETKPLLNLDDNTVAKALAVANRGI